jgi:hypothetical protein
MSSWVETFSPFALVVVIVLSRSAPLFALFEIVRVDEPFAFFTVVSVVVRSMTPSPLVSA